MLLTQLVFVAALTLEVLGSYMSVVGLSSKSSLVLIVLAISLDFSKIVIASVIYKNWKTLNLMFKFFLVPSTIFLMIITSYGSYAYLLQEFGKTTANGEQISIKLNELESERQKLNLRKKEIDNQVANVNPTFVTQKKRLTEMFAKELDYVNSRAIELDKEIPNLKSNKMSDNLSSGTLGSLAKAWGTTPDQTAKILALMMVLVIDPLAIVMLMVGNFLQIKKETDFEKNKILQENKRMEREKREYELKKLKMNIHKEEVESKINQSQVNVEKTIDKDVDIVINKEVKDIERKKEINIKEKEKEKEDLVKVEIKDIEQKKIQQSKEFKSKTSWESSAPLVSVSVKEDKDEDLNKIMELVDKKSTIKKLIPKKIEDKKDVSVSIDDMLNSIEDN